MLKELIIVICCAAPAPAQSPPALTTAPTTRPFRDMSAVIAPHSIIQLDVPFVAGASDTQKLDVYAPQNASGAAVVIYVHGGEWARRDKHEVAYKPRLFNTNKIILVSVNYRLSGTDKHPAQVNDVAAGVRWVRDNIGRYGGDPTRIYLMGHSAGCHLVTLVGLDPRPLATVQMKPSDLAGVISWSGGAFDLVEKHDAGGMYAEYIRQCFGASEDGWRDASPMRHVGQSAMPRFLFVSAEQDNPSSIVASARMVEMIRAAGGRADKFIVAGKDHGGADHDLGAIDDPSGATLLAWMHLH